MLSEEKILQINEIAMSLLRESNKEYYSSLDVKNITDNKRFWKTVKPFLSKKLYIYSENNLNRQW